MSCPNCGELMKSIVRDGRTVFHCSTCGANFFEDNDINRISVESAQRLAEDKYLKILPHVSALKKCPKDGSVMQAVINSEAIPRSVTLFHCRQCNGVFAGADELVHFKKAQHVKIDYFKVWEMPLPHLKSVLIIFVFALLTGSVYFGVNSLYHSASYKSEASELIQKITLYPSGRYILISFKTKTPFISEIIMHDVTTDEILIKPLMKTLSTSHVSTITDIIKSHTYTFKIKLTDKDGKTVETVEKKLEH